MLALAPDNAWAVGEYEQDGPQGRIYRTLVVHWDGQAWAVVPSPSPDAGLNYLSAVAGTAPDDLWTVGVSTTPTPDGPRGLTLTLHWDGQTWQTVPSPNIGAHTNTLSSVTARARDDVWAVGAATGDSRISTAQPLVLHWDGQTWAALPGPAAGPGALTLAQVVTAGDGTVWVAGWSTPPTPDGTLGPGQALLASWDGQVWHQPAVAPPGQGSGLTLLTAAGPHDLWALGTYTNNGPTQPLVLHYTGACP